MPRVILALCALSFLILPGLGQDPSSTSAPDTTDLRKMIEHQSAQIEALTQQISRLTQLLEKRSTIAPADSSAASHPPASSEVIEAPKAVAVPVATGPTHVVAKGETLTSIAKLYKVTVTELQKSNRIENERTLQIGQTLTIPSTKPPDPIP